jgi:hypothetical protein
MTEKKEPWYVYGIVSIVAIVLTYFAFTDYEGFIHPDNTTSGKSGKLFVLIFNGIDSLGGKWLVLAIMLVIIVFLLLKTVKRFKTRNE